MIDIFDSMNTHVTRHMEPKLENLAIKFGINKEKKDLISELTSAIRDMQFKPYLPISLLNDDENVFVINIVNEKLYYMDILYGVEMTIDTLKDNKLHYDKCTVMCIHMASMRLIKFD